MLSTTWAMTRRSSCRPRIIRTRQQRRTAQAPSQMGIRLLQPGVQPPFDQEYLLKPRTKLVHMLLLALRCARLHFLPRSLHSTHQRRLLCPLV